MTNKHRILIIISIACLHNPAANAGYNSIELVANTMRALPKCLDYCITKICTSVKFNPITMTPTFIFHPKISHNLPEYVISSYIRPESHPWEEWGLVVGSAEKAAQTGIIEVTTALLSSGIKISPVGGGFVEGIEANLGVGDNLVFREASVVGHPLVILPELLKKAEQAKEDSEKVDSVDEYVENQEAEAEAEMEEKAKNPLADKCSNNPFAKKESKCSVKDNTDAAKLAAKRFIKDQSVAILMQNDQIRQAMKLNEMLGTATEMLSAVNGLLKIASDIDKAASAVGGMGGVTVRMDRLMCPSPIKPLVPYYLSSLDSFFWRAGWPVTDALYMSTPRKERMFVPEAFEVISPESVFHKYSNNIPLIGTDQWGSIWPRIGSTYQHNTFKASAVIAVRALDVAIRDGDGAARVRYPLGGAVRPGTALQSTGEWQQIYPEVEKQCYENIAHKDIEKLALGKAATTLPFAFESGSTNMEGETSFVYWNEYVCCTSSKGKRVEKLDIPIVKPICF